MQDFLDANDNRTVIRQKLRQYFDGKIVRKDLTKKIKEGSYDHCLDILHKANGNHIIQSYQKRLNSDDFSNMVGLTYKETKLALKKYRQLKRKYKWK